MLRSASALGTSKKMLTNGWPRDAETVHNRTSHAWSRFEGHDELGFIETEWLEKYRQRREAIVHKRLEDFRSRGETPDKKQLGNDEETVLNKSAIEPIRALMRKHLHWHPFKFPRTMPQLPHGKTARLVLYGSVRPWKCTNYARDTTKGMHGSICGKTGTDWINGRFGQEQRRWITTLSYRRTLLSKSIGVTLRIESSISFLAHASIACASNYIVQLYQFLSTKSTKSERVSKTAHGIGTWSTNGRSSNTRLMSRMERI
jgi:hypothetical protein